MELDYLFVVRGILKDDGLKQYVTWFGAAFSGVLTMKYILPATVLSTDLFYRYLLF